MMDKIWLKQVNSDGLVINRENIILFQMLQNDYDPGKYS